MAEGRAMALKHFGTKTSPWLVEVQGLFGEIRPRIEERLQAQWHKAHNAERRIGVTVGLAVVAGFGLVRGRPLNMETPTCVRWWTPWTL